MPLQRRRLICILCTSGQTGRALTEASPRECGLVPGRIVPTCRMAFSGSKIFRCSARPSTLEITPFQCGSQPCLNSKPVLLPGLAALLRDKQAKLPRCVEKFLPVYCPLHWPQTWRQLHFGNLDRTVIDLNWQFSHIVLYTGALTWIPAVFVRRTMIHWGTCFFSVSWLASCWLGSILTC